MLHAAGGSWPIPRGVQMTIQHLRGVPITPRATTVVAIMAIKAIYANLKN